MLNTIETAKLPSEPNNQPPAVANSPPQPVARLIVSYRLTSVLVIVSPYSASSILNSLKIIAVAPHTLCAPI